MNSIRLALFNYYLRQKTRHFRPDLLDKYGIPWVLERNNDLKAMDSQWFCYTAGCRATVYLSWSRDNEFVELADFFLSDHRNRGRGIGSQLLDKAKQFTIELGKAGLVGWISAKDVQGGLRREHPQPHLMDWYRYHQFEVVEFPNPDDAHHVADIRWRVPVK